MRLHVLPLVVQVHRLESFKKKEAEIEALARCSEGGEKDCTIVLSCRNQCVAYTFPKSRMGNSAVVSERSINSYCKINISLRENTPKSELQYNLFCMF
ncbi:DUF4189 domain-containing protein [Xanthomonas arboricola]|uniref:DUF4189 domain-containing protein n=1 Tax=Xanthomonas arboricola TaxID=56448 RepID=UPI0009B81769